MYALRDLAGSVGSIHCNSCSATRFRGVTEFLTSSSSHCAAPTARRPVNDPPGYPRVHYTHRICRTTRAEEALTVYNGGNRRRWRHTAASQRTARTCSDVIQCRPYDLIEICTATTTATTTTIVAPISAVGRLLLQTRQPGTRCQTIDKKPSYR